MAIPQFTQLFRPILECAKDGEIFNDDVIERISKQFKLTVEERNELTPNGQQTRIANRFGWAKSHLKHAGLVEITRWGYFQINDRGRKALASKENIDLAYLDQWEEHRRFHKKTKKTPEPVSSGRSLNTILYGPPGTGKTYATARYCVDICDGQAPESDDETRIRYIKLAEEGRIEFITFHQSYGYEEFIEGLRPETGQTESGDQTSPGFRLVAKDGVLKRIAKRSLNTEIPVPHVLVIDEINRANVSKVLGELVTLLEEDKRQGADNEVTVELPHSGEHFALPPNLYILGTMNTADRSIALLDTALRRRFEFVELAPDPGKLQAAKKATGIDLPAILRAMNERLEWLIDRDHQIGHAWLMNVETRGDVDRIMRHKIIPLISEYFYDDWKKVRAVLGGTDDFVESKRLAPPPGLDGDIGEERRQWKVCESFNVRAYDQLISNRVADEETGEG